MKAVESELSFDDYKISEVVYKQKDIIPDEPIHFDVSFTPKVDFLEKEDDRDNKRQSVLHLSVKITGKQKEEKVIELSVACKGLFSTTGLDDETFSHLVTHNGSAVLITILRAFINSFTSQTGKTSPRIILPLINVSESMKKNAKQGK